MCPGAADLVQGVIPGHAADGKIEEHQGWHLHDVGWGAACVAWATAESDLDCGDWWDAHLDAGTGMAFPETGARSTACSGREFIAQNK